MMPNTKNILQWNLNGFYKNMDETKLLINSHQPHRLISPINQP